MLSIDGYPLGDRPEHPRITYLRGDPAAPSDRGAGAGDRRAGAQGDGHPRGRGGRTQVIDAFRNYAPLVPVGSYVVVEDTILDGQPGLAGFRRRARRPPSDGSSTRASSCRTRRSSATALTFNAGGFLKRVR